MDVEVEVLDNADPAILFCDIDKRNVRHLRRLLYVRKLWILLAVVLSPLVLHAATFGPEVSVARPEYFSAYGDQRASSIACDGQSCVALWVEYDAERRGVYSAAIDTQGNVQPASSNLVISGLLADASIVWTGDHYLATWTALDT